MSLRNDPRPSSCMVSVSATLIRQVTLAMLAFMLGGCGSPDAPAAYPAPTADSYPVAQVRADAYPAPTVQPTLTPIPA